MASGQNAVTVPTHPVCQAQDVYHPPFQTRTLYVKFPTDDTGYLLISLKDK